MNSLPKSWNKFLKDEFSKDYMINLKSFLAGELKAGKTVYPKEKDFFKSLEYCSLENLKVVIIGQDPYHGLSISKS